MDYVNTYLNQCCPYVDHQKQCHTVDKILLLILCQLCISEAFADGCASPFFVVQHGF